MTTENRRKEESTAKTKDSGWNLVQPRRERWVTRQWRRWDSSWLPWGRRFAESSSLRIPSASQIVGMLLPLFAGKNRRRWDSPKGPARTQAYSLLTPLASHTMACFPSFTSFGPGRYQFEPFRLSPARSKFRLIKQRQ